MTEQNPETHDPANPAEPGDKNPDAQDEPTSSTTGAGDGDEPKFAAYDKTYLRFVDGSVGTKAHAKRVGEAAGVKGRRLELRKV